MGYAFHIHFGGEYSQGIKQLFFGGDLKIGKFALAVVQVIVR